MRLKHAFSHVLCLIAAIETCKGQSPLGQTQSNMKKMSKHNLPKEAMNFQDSFFLRDLSRGNRNTVQDFLQYHTFLDKPVDILNNVLGIGSKVTANQQPDFSDIARRLVLLGGGGPRQVGNQGPGKGNAVRMMPVFDPNMKLRKNVVPNQRDNVLFGTGSKFMNFLAGMKNEMQRSDNGLSLERPSFRSNKRQNRPSFQTFNTNSNTAFNRLSSIDGKPMENTQTQPITDIAQAMDNSQIQKIGMLSGLQTNADIMMAEGDLRRRDQLMSRSPVIMGPDDDRVMQFIDNVFAREGAARLGNESSNTLIQSSVIPMNQNTANKNPANGTSIEQTIRTRQQFGNIKGTNTNPLQISRDAQESPALTKLVGNNEQSVANGAPMNEVPVLTNARIFSSKPGPGMEMSGAGMKHEMQNTNLDPESRQFTLSTPANTVVEKMQNSIDQTFGSPSEVADREASILNSNFETIIPNPPSFLESKPNFRDAGAAQSIVNDMSLNGTQGQNLAQPENHINNMDSFNRVSINTAMAEQPESRTQNMREQILQGIKMTQKANEPQKDGQLNPETLWVTLPPRTVDDSAIGGATGVGAVMQSGFSNTGQSMAQPFEKLLTPAPRINIFERTRTRTELSTMNPLVGYPVTTSPMPTAVPRIDTATWPNARQDEIFRTTNTVNSPDMLDSTAQRNIDNGIPWDIGIPGTQAQDNGIFSAGTIGSISQRDVNRKLDANGPPQLSFADVFALWFRNMANQEPYDKLTIAQLSPSTTSSPISNKEQFLSRQTNGQGSNRLFLWFRSQQVDTGISTTPSTTTFRGHQLSFPQDFGTIPTMPTMPTAIGLPSYGTTQRQPLPRLPDIPTSPTMSSSGIVEQHIQRLPALPVLPTIPSSGVREKQFLSRLPALSTLPTKGRKVKYRIKGKRTKAIMGNRKLSGTDRKEMMLQMATWPVPNNLQMPFGNHGNKVNGVSARVRLLPAAGSYFSGPPAISTSTGSTIDC